MSKTIWELVKDNSKKPVIRKGAHILVSLKTSFSWAPISYSRFESDLQWETKVLQEQHPAQGIVLQELLDGVGDYSKVPALPTSGCYL